LVSSKIKAGFDSQVIAPRNHANWSKEDYLDTFFYWLGLSPLVRRQRMRKTLKTALSQPELSSPALASVSRAFDLASNLKAGDRHDRTVWKAIERRRRDLLKRRETVQVTDYGAGDRNKLQTEDEQRLGVVRNISMQHLVSTSSDPVWCRVLFSMTRIHRPSAVLELGTCVGISGSYIAAALRMNNRGHLWTLEGSPVSAKLANETFRDLDLQDFASVCIGPFSETFEPCLQSVRSFDLAFIDGHHDGKATINYFKRLKRKLQPGSIIAFDDVDYSASMEDAWQHVTNDAGVVGHVRVGGRGVISFGTR
jgi:predicted O-methyltransferase YrrM